VNQAAVVSKNLSLMTRTSNSSGMKALNTFITTPMDLMVLRVIYILAVTTSYLVDLKLIPPDSSIK
jgi:hypothetical protein